MPIRHPRLPHRASFPLPVRDNKRSPVHAGEGRGPSGSAVAQPWPVWKPTDEPKKSPSPPAASSEAAGQRTGRGNRQQILLPKLIGARRRQSTARTPSQSRSPCRTRFPLLGHVFFCWCFSASTQWPLRDTGAGGHAPRTGGMDGLR